MPLDIHAVLLDMDGTVVDAFTPIVRAMQQTLKEFDLPILSEREIRRHTGQGDCSMKTLFGAHQEAASQRFIELHDEDYLTGLKPLLGAEAFFKDMQQQGMPVAIVTSKGQHRAEHQLQHLGWQPWIHTVVGKVKERANKPNPASLYVAAKAMGIDIHKTVMIGDGIADMKAAVRAESYGVGISASFSQEELQHVGASKVFANIPEVHTWLNHQIR
ncbi:MAG: HAD family hydrolase [Mariprofundaceae bacterium]|nr:HAD family hydrolase [Mariprofundaceae bacterium]